MMSQDESTKPAISTDEAKVAVPVPNDLPALSPEARTALENLVPLLVEPETLIQGLRFLQQRIPGFEQLSREEERSMIKAAHLDPEILEMGLHVAGAWPQAKAVLGYSGEELQRMADQARRWSGPQRELTVLLHGISGANLRLKFTLGRSILRLYAVLRHATAMKNSPYAHLRPHLEEMRRAFARQRKGRGRKKNDPA